VANVDEVGETRLLVEEVCGCTVAAVDGVEAGTVTYTTTVATSSCA